MSCVCAARSANDSHTHTRRRSAVRAPSRTRSAPASRKPERRRVPPGVENTAVETNALSRPGRALARRADGDVPLYGARTRDCLPSQLGRTTGALERRSSRQSRAAGASARARADRRRRRRRRPTGCGGVGRRRDGSSRARAPACRRRIGLAEYPVYDPQTGVARDPWVTEAAMCVRLVDVRITCGLHDDAQIAAVFIDPRAK